ncbi:DNRLRE domain-containing protein [Myxococcus qinghaiensis]|uniref:DNRLRE domain-containing protein n=1 Tax=Myxococcus qinghaiensis TaxID=2906758 RepID=UPI0020A6F893|nr:DNRLRE domain-containing protein [Myxococcus qinghaiensis]MCP3166674.1 DNRLRE domain-containing protein [Myxococcus qinghaiensis]
MHSHRDVFTGTSPAVWLLLLSIPLLSACGTGPDEASIEEDSSNQSLSGITCVTFRRGVNGTVADTTIASLTPNANFGSLQLNVDYLNPILLTSRQEALLRFDLSSIPANVTVNSATLQLFAVAQLNAVTVHAATAAWDEFTVTFNSFNQQFNPTVRATIPPAALSVRNVNVTGLVSDWVSGSLANNGFLLDTAATAVSIPSIFYSGESTDVGNRPGLEVCYTPPECAQTNGQCGGTGWSGPTCCQGGFTCTYLTDLYSQCLPG